jgi:hypothetical protein
VLVAPVRQLADLALIVTVVQAVAVEVAQAEVVVLVAAALVVVLVAEAAVVEEVVASNQPSTLHNSSTRTPSKLTLKSTYQSTSLLTSSSAL